MDNNRRKNVSGHPRVGLALGGGGARGLAQIGVLKVFVNENIPIDLIAGASMGSIIGGIYAFLGDMGDLEDVCMEYFPQIPELEGMGNFRKMPRTQKATFGRVFHFLKELYILRIGTTRTSLVDNKLIKGMLDEVLGNHTFDDLKIPFAAVATDLRNGEEVIIREGELAMALLASSAIPGIFEPVELDGRLLVDGNVTSQVPVEAAKKMGADLVIAVNVEASLKGGKLRNGIEILFHIDDLRAAELNQIKLAQADVVITPKIGHINWANFSKIEECIHCGERAAESMLPEIRKKIAELTPKFWKRIFRPFSRKERRERRSVDYY
jgi:NTE family protein